MAAIAGQRTALRASTLISRVNKFWYKDFVPNKPPSPECTALWFNGAHTQHDAYVRANFEDDILAYMNEKGDEVEGPYSELEDTREGAQALILLGDQFTKFMWRGYEDMYYYDVGFQLLSWKCIHKLWHKDPSVNHIERIFMYEPLLRAESVSSAEACFDKAAELVKTAPLVYRPYCSVWEAYVREHLALLQRFGRYPARNDVLGREDTPEEAAYLAAMKAAAPSEVASPHRPSPEAQGLEPHTPRSLPRHGLIE